MQQFLIWMLTAYLLVLADCEETFENSSKLCERCKCINEETFILDCTNQNFEHMIGNWPDHTTPLTATFSYNSMPHLEVLPASNLVQDVILSHCDIKSIDSGAFKAIKFIKYLDLSYNFLTTQEISAVAFKGPYNNTVYEPLALEDLDLSYNIIHSLPKNVFEHLKDTLKQLNLAGNRLKVLDPPTQLALSGLEHLQMLNLSNNRLTDLVGAAITNLQKLRILDLSGNLLDFVPETLPYLSEFLEAVYLDRNLIFHIYDESFLGVKGIKVLSLTQLPRLTNVGANAFVPLTNLSVLYLCDNPKLESIDREAFSTNQTLKEFYIHNNSLQALHYNLTNWKTLHQFTLTGNDLVCDCDLYEIAQDLRLEIKQNSDGPHCIHPATYRSMMIYNLSKEACNYEQSTFRPIHAMNHHFRLIMGCSVIIVTLTAALAVFIVILRCRRHRMNQSYAFATRVTYNPLSNRSANN